MLVFGIDGGIASVGWAVADIGDADARIVAAGTWMFDTPETAKAGGISFPRAFHQSALPGLVLISRHSRSDLPGLVQSFRVAPDARASQK